jgi:hypothetical protein
MFAIGQCFEPVLFGRVAGPLRLPFAADQKVPQHVPRDGQQPGPERTLARLVVASLHGPRDRPQDFLSHVGRVGILQAALALIAVHQRRVDVHELRPGRVVPGVANPHEQTVSRRRRFGHPVTSIIRYNAQVRNLTPAIMRSIRYNLQPPSCGKP